MTIFTSRNNPKIKQIRSLRRSQRSSERSSTFLVEGIRHVGEAVEAGAAIDYLVYAPQGLASDFALNLISRLEELGVPCLAVEEGVFTSIAEKDHPQSLIAVVRRSALPLAQLNPSRAAWIAALVSPQDPGNVGTILRTLDAVGADALVLLDNGVDPYHSSAVRASMGAIFWLPIIQASFEEFSRWSKHNRYHVYGTSAHASQDTHAVLAYQKPAVLLLGSERQGLTQEQAALCEALIRLPMVGRTTSLNLSVAAGVMLYDMLAKFSRSEP